MTVFNINVSVVNVYREPSFSSEVVTQALLGESCQILNTDQQWYKIQQPDEYIGWVNNFFGKESNTRYNPTHLCFSVFAPVYNKKGGTPIRDICFGNRLKMIENKKEYNVILPDNTLGWIDADLRKKPLEQTRENIIQIARRFNGTPYQWGGKSPAGMDCSGFVQLVFNMVGIQLPRDAYQQAEYLQKSKVNINSIEEGDLLFFAEKDKINHVAISLGGREFIHAQGWVKEDSLNPERDNYHPRLDELFTSAHSIKGWIV